MHASSSFLLLLVGLLTLWAELTPIAGQEAPPEDSERCQLPPETGPCRAKIPRWYYNHTQQQCLQFIYGGCQGNSNNFQTEEECQEACGEAEPAESKA